MECTDESFKILPDIVFKKKKKKLIDQEVKHQVKRTG